MEISGSYKYLDPAGKLLADIAKLLSQVVYYICLYCPQACPHGLGIGVTSGTMGVASEIIMIIQIYWQKCGNLGNVSSFLARASLFSPALMKLCY